MSITKLIFYIYLLLITFVLLTVSVTNISFFGILTSLLLLIIIYISFFLGVKLKFRYSNVIKSVYNEEKYTFFSKKMMVFLSILSMIFSVLSTQFYTGLSPQEVFESLSNGDSIYYQYQNYFLNNNLESFSLSKLPYILMMFYCKFLMIYSYILIAKSKKKLKTIDFIFLFIITLAHLYLGIARGTNFEVFEWIMLLFFILLSLNNLKQKIIIKRITLLIMISIGGITVFSNNISARGVKYGTYITKDVFIDAGSFISSNFPITQNLVSSLFGYFSFGFYYTSTVINYFWMNNMISFFSSMFPYGYKMFVNKNLENDINGVIDTEAKWSPDSMVIFFNYGLIGLILFSLILGLLLKLIINKNNKNIYDYIFIYIIFVQMISLPIGNFVTISSSTKLLVIFVVSTQVLSFINKKNNKKNEMNIKKWRN